MCRSPSRRSVWARCGLEDGVHEEVVAHYVAGEVVANVAEDGVDVVGAVLSVVVRV